MKRLILALTLLSAMMLGIISAPAPARAPTPMAVLIVPPVPAAPLVPKKDTEAIGSLPKDGPYTVLIGDCWESDELSLCNDPTSGGWFAIWPDHDYVISQSHAVGTMDGFHGVATLGDHNTVTGSGSGTITLGEVSTLTHRCLGPDPTYIQHPGGVITVDPGEFVDVST